ncbi:hypothetical protein OROMI_008319 [Orobanche minor]
MFEPSEEEIALSIFPPVADQIGSGVAFEKSTDVPAEGEKRGYNESRSSSSSSDSGSSSSVDNFSTPYIIDPPMPYYSDSDRSHMDPMQGIHRSLKTIKIKLWLGGFSRYLGEANSYVVELWAVWECLKMARGLGFSKIELQVDSKAVMASISNHMADSFNYRGLFGRVKQVLEQEWQVKVSHVYREANSMADCLASMGCEPSDELCIYHHPPDFILHFMHADCNGVSTPRQITG